MGILRRSLSDSEVDLATSFQVKSMNSSWPQSLPTHKKYLPKNRVNQCKKTDMYLIDLNIMSLRAGIGRPKAAECELRQPAQTSVNGLQTQGGTCSPKIIDN